MPLIDELEGVLRWEKLAKKVLEAGVEVEKLVAKYRAAVLVVAHADIEPVVSHDPDDDNVLACAVASGAEAIVSGDPHLLALGEFRGIPILKPCVLLRRIGVE